MADHILMGKGLDEDVRYSFSTFIFLSYTKQCTIKIPISWFKLHQSSM